MSQAMPLAPQKSSISWVSAMPPISDPERFRRGMIRLKALICCGFGGTPTSASVPSTLRSCM